jgi:hypothetical protein
VTISFHLLWTLRAVWEEYANHTKKIDGGDDKRDISKNGPVISGLYILVVGCAIWGVAFAVLLEGYTGGYIWAQATGRHLWNTIVMLGGHSPF